MLELRKGNKKIKASYSREQTTHRETREISRSLKSETGGMKNGKDQGKNG